MKGKTIKLVIFALVSLACVVLGFAVEPFEGLETGGMRFLAVFVWWIALMILDLVPMHVSTIAACLLCVLVGVPDAATIAFSQWGSNVVLLMLGAFGIAASLSASGLLRRIALTVVHVAPKKGLAQLLAFELATMLITPWIPAAVGKQALLVPISEQIAGQLGYQPHSRAYTAFFAIVATATAAFGLCFLTGHGSVATSLAFIPYTVDWLGWISRTWVYLVVALGLFTLFLVWYFKSSAKKDGAVEVDGAALAKAVDEQLAEMGKMGGKELYSAFVLVLAIVFFLIGGFIGVPAHAVALGAWLLLAAGGLFSAQDFQTKINWQIVILVGSILGLVALLQSSGVAAWIAALTGPVIAPLAASPVVLIMVLVLFTYVLRFAMVPPTTILALVCAAFAASPIDPFVFAFSIMISAQIWIMSYMNPTVLASMGFTAGRVVQKDLTLSAAAFMAINFIALVASVPYWAGLGLL
ncbi:SLC13 family permease [Eggerthella sinensis]|uniref:SLC13 family permease n=1 Tax=Eggerthella sinensis TaxID=242230 RepID=UPI00248D5905|nr:SLC13 family permease [Eggerthella sinensis]